MQSNGGGDLELSAIVGLAPLWARTLGHQQIRVAVLDGPVDLSHPAFIGAKLDLIGPATRGATFSGAAAGHGTHVASVIFGQHDSPVRGVAPHCHGLILPIFEDGANGSLAPASQIDLAHAIARAADAGAHVINVSGGQLSQSGEAHPLLARAVMASVERGILLVAAAGNDGCACLHVPGALPSVLPVGAMNAKGVPLDFSNWGHLYRGQGILAYGENIIGAKVGGGLETYSGTSVAAPVVAGVAALLLSWQLQQGHPLDAQTVRRAILASALGCEHQSVPDCDRLLMGRLNVQGAFSIINRGEDVVVDQHQSHEPVPRPHAHSTAGMPAPPAAAPGSEHVVPSKCAPPATTDDENGADSMTSMPADANGAPQVEPAAARLSATPALYPRTLPAVPGMRPAGPQPPVGPGLYNYLYPSACGCGGSRAPQLVYALGQIYYDFGTDARRDSLGQAMGLVLGAEGQPENPFDLLKFLDTNPWDSAAVIWTLNDETTPMYAIQPEGPYTQENYARLRQFLREQLEEGVERVSIPGYLAGGKVRLYTGQEIPVIHPELRGMFSWTSTALVEAVCGAPPPDSASEARKQQYVAKAGELRSFLDRIYYDIRNLGLDPRERAVNYSATNAFNIEHVFERAVKEQMALDIIEVEQSPICRPDSDCWDVKLTFFNPEKQFEVARKVYRFTVDVSDIVPVLVGSVRQWAIR